MDAVAKHDSGWGEVMDDAVGESDVGMQAGKTRHKITERLVKKQKAKAAPCCMDFSIADNLAYYRLRIFFI